MTYAVKKMDPEVKDKWVAALKSGKYTKATGQLKKPEGHCCLGVLCELHKIEYPDGYDFFYGGMNYGSLDDKSEKSMLPRAVNNWSELPDEPTVVFEGGIWPLWQLNDRKECDGNPVSFSQIADLIQEQM